MLGVVAIFTFSSVPGAVAAGALVGAGLFGAAGATGALGAGAGAPLVQATSARHMVMTRRVQSERRMACLLAQGARYRCLPPGRGSRACAESTNVAQRRSTRTRSE